MESSVTGSVDVSFSSPFASFISVSFSFGTTTESSVITSVGVSTGASVIASVGVSTGSSVITSVGVSTGTSVIASVGVSTGASVSFSTGSSVDDWKDSASEVCVSDSVDCFVISVSAADTVPEIRLSAAAAASIHLAFLKQNQFLCSFFIVLSSFCHLC